VVIDNTSSRTIAAHQRVGFAHRVVGIERKPDELLKEHRKQPDGLFFEVLVALAYAEEGWDVTFIEEGQDKTPDMRIVRGDQEFFVECKRMVRTTDNSEKERNQFLRLWDAGRHVLLEKRQWVWFKGTFHVDPAELPDNFLLDLWLSSLPIGLGERVPMDNEQATIKARLIDQAGVRRHMREFRGKANSPMLTQVIGGDWAPEDASVTLLPMIKRGHVNGCEVSELGMYVEEVAFACGFRRNFDSKISIHVTPASERLWPLTASCNWHGPPESCADAIGGTRPDTALPATVPNVR